MAGDQALCCLACVAKAVEQKPCRRGMQSYLGLFAHHKFRELCRSFVEVNEKICRLRPVEQEQEPAASLTPREKKRPRRSNKKLPKK